MRLLGDPCCCKYPIRLYKLDLHNTVIRVYRLHLKAFQNLKIKFVRYHRYQLILGLPKNKHV